MNVVGKVSNFVYSVATPFHPFGGAVDIIVVQQQDGSFRSTPWYVRFGKFQGVLKGAEKLVKVEVNGVEANFHMHLDNSGEAYFIEEVVSDKESDTKDSESVEGRKEDNKNDCGDEDDSRKENVNSGDGAVEMRDERVTLGMDLLERKESMRFYDFQDEQSSQDESVDFSEYNDIDNVEQVLESQTSSEVILVSVDGHVLTAPITSAEKNGEEVEISTPRFHLGADTELTVGEVDGLSDLNTASSGLASADVYDKNKNHNALENRPAGIKKDEVFKSCLQLSELAIQGEKANHHETDPSSDDNEIAKGESLENSEAINEAQSVGRSGNGDGIECSSSDTIEKNALVSDRSCSNSTSIDSDFRHEKPEEQIEVLLAAGVQNGQPAVVPERECTKTENTEPQTATSSQNISDLAAEASDANQIPVEANDAIPMEEEQKLKTKEDDSGTSSTPSGSRWSLWPNPFRRVKTLETTSDEEVFVDSESGTQNPPVELTPTTSVGSESPHKQLVRTNVPTSDHIASLDLNEGQNMVTFIFSTRYLGVQKVDAHIYLWKWNARIVISDVDGTITKSDVLGQFMPLVGKDWTHTGIAHFFSAIKENGYQLLFLSARAIVQAYLTRSFLFNLKQDGKTLPDGPVVISPDGLFPSLYREVIRRAPHEFKIACLEDIKALFPSDYNPFYAGFGNRDTDELSYRKIGIPKGKIFIINPKGEVAINRRIDVKSYTSLHTLVNDMFPPTSLVEQEDYNSWNFWKTPLPDIEDM